MLKNHFIVALRNFWRNKTFSLINIFGLAIGISAALVIYLIVQYDFSFDKFHKNGDRIYRVVSDFSFSGEAFHNSGVTAPMGNALRKEMTGVELVVPIWMADHDTKVTLPASSIRQEVVFKDQKFTAYTDEAYFRMIPYTWLAGSPKSALVQPYQVVLTENRAKTYFPGISPAEMIGSKLFINDTVAVTVSGVVKDIEQHTDFTFATFISRATLENTKLKPDAWEQWDNTTSSSQLMVMLSAGTPVATAEKGILRIYDKYHKKEAGDNSKTAYALQPLNDIHFNERYSNFEQRLAHKPTLYGLLAAAAFLLLLGCINFINLTTAQATQLPKK